MRSRAFWPVLGATAVAVALASLWFAAGYPGLIYDGWGYYKLAEILRGPGLRAWPSDVRAYGYALFEAAVTGFREHPPEEFRRIVFLSQLAVYLGACGLVARRLGRIFASPRAGVVAYVLGALNPILLLHTTEPLSDLLSAVLVLLAVAFVWRLPDASPRALAWDPFWSFLCAGAAVAVRPANLVVVGALAAAWAIRAWRWREVGGRGLIAAAAGLVPLFLPQVAINHALYGTYSPFIQKNLYSLQTSWGMAGLKYGTLVMPGRSPLLVYVNPWYAGDASPSAFLARDPIGYAATLLLHGFAMLDRDLPFTYVTDFDPWYRWPLSILNFGLLYLALAGFVLAWARWRRQERRLDEAGFVALSAAGVAGAYVLLHLPVEVESRFGLPLLALATPLIVAGWQAAREPRAARLVALLAIPAIGAALLLSGWVSRHRTNPAPNPPPAAAAESGARNQLVGRGHGDRCFDGDAPPPGQQDARSQREEKQGEGTRHPIGGGRLA